MKERLASVKSLVHALSMLTNEEKLALVDNPAELKLLAAGLLQKLAESTYFIGISDDEATNLLTPKYGKKEAARIVRAWRKFASDLGYTGPVAWRVRAGFTLKLHAPRAGRCYRNWQHLQGWNLKNDEPTKDSLIFWIPVLLPESTGKDVVGQTALLAKFREDYHLPVHHLASFGTAAELAGLIFAHAKRTGKCVPENCYWTRTDTCHADGGRLDLGDFGGDGLRCDDWGWGGDGDADLGAFALGVEALGQ